MASELGAFYVSVVPSFKGGSSAIAKELRGIGDTAGKSMSGSMASAVEKDTSKSGRLGKAFGGIGGIIAGGFAGGAAIKAVTDVVGGFVSAAQESQVVGKQTAEVLKSTGGAAGVSALQISDLATSLSLKSGVDDEVVQSGENVLLTFTKVANQAGKGNDIFNQGTSIALDMSTALGTDLQGSVIQVGKALNDPIKGITALQRVGVTFTDQQKEQIKTLVESGDTLGAQKIILGELNTEFGGMAAASATSGDKLKVAWGNVQEQLGNVLLPIFEKVATWLSEELPGAVAWAQDAIGTVQAFFEEHRKQFEAVGTVLRLLFDYLKIEVKVFVEAVKIEFAVIRDIVIFFNDWVYQPLKTAFTALFDFLLPYVQGAVSGIITTWHVIQDVYTFFRDNVYNPVKSTVLALIGDVSGAFGQAVSGAKTAWNVILDVFTFFRDNVYQPVIDTVGALRDGVTGAIQTAVDTATTIWHGLGQIYGWFITNVQDPVMSVVNRLKDDIGNAFQLGVDAVKRVWDGLKAAVGAPINVVIDFYNRGIAGLWNFIASKVSLPQLSPIDRVQFATGGKVPGIGNRDTVDAKLTPGEFVINKKSAAMIGEKALEALNSGGTIDPAILGYAGGGPVRTVAETQAWAQAQAGKPYVFPLSGPTAYDCSGLMSALINFVLGASNPYSRRHSSGSVGSDSALQPGIGDPATGLSIGARPPYTTNRQGQSVGHEAGTVAGLNVEATPPAVRVGGIARGAGNSLFTQQYHMPNFGGPTADEQSIIDKLKALAALVLPNLGGSSFAGMLTKLFTGLPGMVFDFLVNKMPDIIKNAMVDAGLAVGPPANPVGGLIGIIRHIFGDGGEIPTNGPVLVGERGVPEVLWGSKGRYVESLPNPARGWPNEREIHFHYETRQPTATEIAGAFQMARLAS